MVCKLANLGFLISVVLENTDYLNPCLMSSRNVADCVGWIELDFTFSVPNSMHELQHIIIDAHVVSNMVVD